MIELFELIKNKTMATDFNHFNKFTKEAKRALIIAQEKAKDSGLNYVGTEHILMGVLAQENSLGASILLNFGVSTENVNLVLKTVGRTSVPKQSASKASGGLSGFAKEVIEGSVKSAHEFGHAFVGTEHLLYSLVSQDNTAATVILENMKVSPADVKEQILEIFERAKDVPKDSDAPTDVVGSKSPLFNCDVKAATESSGGVALTLLTQLRYLNCVITFIISSFSLSTKNIK